MLLMIFSKNVYNLSALELFLAFSTNHDVKKVSLNGAKIRVNS